jgi:hypothetical protein
MRETTSAGLALISNDRQTLDGVKDYFERAGARVRTTSRLDEAEETAAGTDAVVFFADDYPLEDATITLAALSARLIVVVTVEVAAFSARRARWTKAGHVIVLPRPAWGWVLLEAVHEGLPRWEPRP